MNFIKKISFLVFCVLLFAACQGAPVREDAPLEQPRDIAAMRPAVQDREMLTVVFSRHNIQLDFRQSFFASEAQLFTGIYEGLFTYHPLTLDPVPAVAQRWELSEDRKQWTFHLRRNARFSNGDPVRAEDFRASWISLLEPQRRSPYSSKFDLIQGARDFRMGLDANPDNVGIIAQDDHTLIVRLNFPASFFPMMLCHHSFGPIHPSMIDVEDWSANLPISNGPFRIVSINEEEAVLLRNEYYWDRENVALNRINIRFAETGDEAAALWNSGKARWIAGNVNLDALTDRSGIQVNIMFATHYYFIRSETEPWTDYRVRRAMALALPWEEIRGGHFLPAQTLIFPIAGYPRIEGITEQNIEEAKALMAKAGFADGVDAPELVIRITPSIDAANIASLMSRAWYKYLGFNVRVEVVPFEYYFQSLREGGFVVGSSTWIGDFADPFAFLLMWMKNSNLNDALHYDPEFEKLIERSMTEEGLERFATLAEAERLLLYRGTVLPISFVPALNIIDVNELGGWFPNALNIHPLKYLYFRASRLLPGVALLK